MRTSLNTATVAVMLAAALGGTNAMAANEKSATAVLGGGCFWCLEAVFEELAGVEKVVSGYAGGRGPATYEEVCTGETGHAEVVEITYDPARITYRDLLTVFFATHDPTTLNRQGADVGTQYRSAIFYANDAQKKDAEAAIAKLQTDRVYRDPVVTEVAPLERFYQAEDYHQNYYANNRAQGYCQVVINPKLAKFRKEFADKLDN